MSLGKLLGGCAACCVCAPEKREIGRWRIFKGVARWWQSVRWVQVELMVRFGLEGGRSIDEDVVDNE